MPQQVPLPVQSPTLNQNQIIGTNSNPNGAKTSGLKNRIRPPPLILDKVSNFLDDQTLTSPSKQSQPLERQISASDLQISNGHNNNNNNNNHYHHTGSNNKSNNTNSVNHKFWASLNNQNSALKGRTSTVADSVPSAALMPSNEAAASNSQFVESANALGADLIISQRNNSNTKLHDLSNNSEPDDYSTHGGNLIDVDHSTTPPNVGTHEALHAGVDSDQPFSQSSPSETTNNKVIHAHPTFEPSTNHDSTISMESETAICKPPPSKTMQVPYWTEAIYELNNASLESRSLAGGVENGEFIYILESGDIILELDQIKVSGFTLIEFKELVESSELHLLKAVQTKHSRGLTPNLKHYLSCGFPKDSIDKQLQDLIRENIYKRTIPCTTRPPREGEVDKVDYHFLTKDQFIELNSRGLLLECGMYDGHYYGTLRPLIDLNTLFAYSAPEQMSPARQIPEMVAYAQQNNSGSYEIELIKSSMGFGFTLVEAENGILLVRSVISGGPAHMSGMIRPGDILVSAMGVSVSGMQHTDIARLFSTFAVGDRIRLAFVRSSYIMDDSIIPDEYLFTNGTDGGQAPSINSSQFNHYYSQGPQEKMAMMQLQQRQQQQYQPIVAPNISDYQPMPLYSNRDMIELDSSSLAMMNQQILPDPNYNNFYTNSDELSLQRMQYGYQPNQWALSTIGQQQSHNYGAMNFSEDDYEYLQVDLIRNSPDLNWGIRLIGGSEADRAISIGSIVCGGIASRNGNLRSGDEIISINNINVEGATHQHVVELISASSNKASLVVRRRKFADACDVVLERNLDEGFGFVIISKRNCSLIGRIIEGSPADRCQQLHVKDRIIAVNGRYITPEMQHPEIVNMIKECGSTLRLRIIPADCYTVELVKNPQDDSFGFSLRGGAEFDGSPLYIIRVAPNGPRDSLNVGDQIMEINNISTAGMTHLQAATIIKHSDVVKLKLRRVRDQQGSVMVRPREVSQISMPDA